MQIAFRPRFAVNASFEKENVQVTKPSDRIMRSVAALPLRPGMRVLEIGCGPGVAARLVASNVGDGFVLGIDRSLAAVTQARRGSQDLIVRGLLDYRQVAVEHFELKDGEEPFDLAFAFRVGALDGRHPSNGRVALERLRRSLVPSARLYIDGGSPLREINPFSELC